MTVTAPRKYNPGFLDDDELVASFCVRTSEFESIVETLRECTGSANTHQIVIGPRGSGKTSLLLRVAVEARRDAGLSSAFFPIVFAEESYEISTAGEFWLECLSRLADQAPSREGDPDLRRSFEDLRTVRDDRTLGGRCLGALQDFSDREDKRLVLMVENLNMMFRDMADSDAGWRLREVLQTEPRIVLLASATSRFDEIDNSEHALYDLFRTLTLGPLDTNECAVLWEAASGRRVPPETIRSLEILTGGSPRLLAIVARFGAGRSFRDLMADLLDLIDDHTEYFKSHLESLPAQERRVYLALADLWKPALTKEIADRARLDTSKCSAQLARLVERGVVQPAGGSARRKQYYLSERLYNIYYLLRRGRGPDRLIEALIRLMASYYSPHELKEIGVHLVHEAQGFDAEMRSLHRSAFARLMELPALAADREELLAMAPPEFAEIPDPGSEPPDAARPDRDRAGRLDANTDERSEAVAAQALFNKAVALADRKRAEDAMAAYDELVSRFKTSESPFVLDFIAKALVNGGAVLRTLNRWEEALAAWDEVVRRFSEGRTPVLLEMVAKALANRGAVLGTLNRWEEALAACNEVVRRFGESEAPTLLEVVGRALVNRGAALGILNRREEALSVCDEVVRRFGESEAPTLLELVAKALVNRGTALGTLNRREEALSVCDEVVRRFGESEAPTLLELVAKALVNRGTVLRTLNRLEEALATWDEVVRRFGESEALALREQVAAALASRGAVLGTLNRREEALAAWDEVVRRFGESEALALREQVAAALANRGAVLGTLNRREEALAVCDEVVRRFGEGRTPALLEAVATALANRGAMLGMLNRQEEALAAWDEVVRRFGEGRTPALLEAVATALANRGAVLGTLSRREEALAASDEVVRRFGEGRTPALLEAVARALANRGAVLGTLSRREEALAASDEVVRRFGESEALALREQVAAALVNKGSALHALNRPEEALAAYDEVVHRFGEGRSLAFLEAVAMALVNKGIALDVLNRPEEALAAYDEAVRRFGKHGSPALHMPIRLAFLGKAELELKRRRYEAAVGAASRALDRNPTELPTQSRGYLIRAKASLAGGDPAACERDIEAMLAILPKLDPLPRGILDALVKFVVEIGSERMRELIQASSAADLLLPLTTALEWELGLKPRVAREVEEVAGDIRRDLENLREARADGAG